MRPIDIGPADLETIRRILCKHTPGLEVRVFGSRVSWTARETSDLDLALMTDEPLTVARVADLRAAFTESDLPFRVDIVDWASTSESFRKAIERDHVVLAAVDGEPFDGRRSGVVGDWPTDRFERLLTEPVRNGIYKRKEFHGRGAKIVNMGELFAHPRLRAVPMKRVELSESEADRFLITTGDLLFARRSLVAEGAGKCCVVLNVDEPTTFESSIIRARPDSTKANYLYLYYFFNSALGLYHLDTIRRQVAVAGITGSDLAKLEIPVPFLPEQRAIAHILGTLDDKIELNRRMNVTLEAMARALFRSWFVDFDPLRAKMEGRDTGLPEDIADLFPNRLVESELGEIPEGWRLRPLDSVARFQNGLPLQKFRPAENETRLPVVKIAQLRAGETNSGEWASSTIKPGCIIENGDVVFSWSGSLLVQMWCGGRAALNQHLFKVTSEEYPKWFYLHSILSHFPEFQQTAKDKATTMEHIRRHHLTDALCVVPPDGVIARVSEMFGGLLERQVANEVAGRALVTLRNTLLPKLVSGELRVNVLEAAVGRDDRPVSVDAREA